MTDIYYPPECTTPGKRSNYTKGVKASQKLVAQVLPTYDTPEKARERDVFWRACDRLGGPAGDYWGGGLSAEQVVSKCPGIYFVSADNDPRYKRALLQHAHSVGFVPWARDAANLDVRFRVFFLDTMSGVAGACKQAAAMAPKMDPSGLLLTTVMGLDRVDARAYRGAAYASELTIATGMEPVLVLEYNRPTGHRNYLIGLTGWTNHYHRVPVHSINAGLVSRRRWVAKRWGFLVVGERVRDGLIRARMRTVHGRTTDPRPCEWCGSLIPLSRRLRSPYCSERCMRQAKVVKERLFRVQKWLAEHGLPADYMETRRCAFCGGQMDGKKAGAKYCSRSCLRRMTGR